MTLFKLNFLLLSITVCQRFSAVAGAENLARQNDAVTRNAMIERFVWLQSCDRGCVAKPNIEAHTLRTMSLDAVIVLVQEAYVEMQCSYLYSALTYLHLIDAYVSSPMTLVNPDWEELNGLLFSVESATMVALAHASQHQSWTTIRAVMWLFHTFAEKTANFLVTDQSDYPDIDTVYKSVIAPYKAMIILLEECAGAIGCVAYDQVTGRPDNLTYVEKIRNGISRDRQKTSSELSRNKSRFWAQTERNEQLGFTANKSCFIDFFVDNLLLAVARNGGKMTTTLFNTFGVQLQWQPIVVMLDYYYGLATNGIIVASLQEYIIALHLFQNQFICVLKAIAMRTVVFYLLQLQHAVETSSSRQDLIRFTNDNKRVAGGLKAFGACIYLVDDQHLMMIIEWMKKPWNHFETPEQVGNLVIDIQELLREMSSPANGFGVRFDEPITYNVNIHKQVMDGAVEFARDNMITISEDVENIILIDIYVEFIKRMADFHVINSFANLPTSGVFRRFEDLEKEQQRP